MKFNHRLHCAAADWSETFASRCGIGTRKDFTLLENMAS
jgi:hypothetical protein